MKLIICLSAAALFCLSSFAQTKRIAFRSHAGLQSARASGSDSWGLPGKEYMEEERRKNDSIRRAWEFRTRQDSIIAARDKKIKTDSLRRLQTRKRKQ